MHFISSARRGQNIFGKSVDSTHFHELGAPLRHQLDPERWGRLMHWLGPEDAQAGQNYTNLHAKLIYWFERHGCKHASECADETFNRVAEKIGAVEIHNPWGYLLGVAKKILLEYYRDRMRITSLDNSPAEHPANITDVEETIDGARILLCLDRCVSKLADPEREIVTEYVGTQDLDLPRPSANWLRRAILAERLSITRSALAQRYFKARHKLQECVGECLARG